MEKITQKENIFYIKTYIELDVRTLVNVKDLRKFEVFLTLLAGRTGQLVNLSSLSGDVGVSSTTLKDWLSALEASHIIFTLEPWFGNISKRLTKAPKIFFADTGIPCSLLSLTNAERVEKDALFGNLFENLVIVEALKARLNSNKKPNLNFLRTESGIEIDLLDTADGNIVPYEIKSSDTIIQEFFKNFTKAEKFMPNFLKANGALIYSGDNLDSFLGYKAINFRETEKFFG